MSGFVKRLVLSMVASKLERATRRRGYTPMVGGLLREVNHHLGYGLTRRRRYGHRGHCHGHSGYHGHYRHKHW